MYSFPTVDPIPVPAPIWLLKALHIVTMSLHFVAVQMVLGGLLVALCLHIFGRRTESRTAAAAIARRLPIVMTYVINLGVPPLLFAQVLYGRTLYTSSVLIGAWWIAVIPLLAICYWQLYFFSAKVEEGKSGWWFGAIAFLLAGLIAQIYTGNMTLMLRPEVWQSMYQTSPGGVHLPSGDPTMPWRLLSMFCGGLMLSGLWLLWISTRSVFEPSASRFMAKLGGRLAAAMALVEMAVIPQVVRSQPAGVQQALAADPLAQGASYAWMAMAALALLVGLWGGFTQAGRVLLPWVALVVAVVRTVSIALYRDVLRDQTLLSKGFDVWQRNVITNWGVVILFLVLFVGGLATVGWLMSVVAKARPVMEKIA
jgi:hypothetical protein